MMRSGVSSFPTLMRALALVASLLVIMPVLAVVLFSLSSFLNVFADLVPGYEAISAKILFALRAVIVAVVVSLSYYVISDWLSRRINGADPGGRQRIEDFQPWLFVGPALFMVAVFLIIPALETFRLSLTSDVPLRDISGAILLNDAGVTMTEKGFVGFFNYAFLMKSDDFWFAIRNSVLWLLVVPTCCIAFGMLIAVLADRLVWGTAAKSLIFVPLAISFVGAAVIWRNIYAAGGAGGFELGLVNALLRPFGVEPRFWYETEFWGNFFMMSIMVWIQTGLAMVIFSAALRSVPAETLEAARIDGATEFQIFFRVTLPQITGTVLVVWTTLVILVLKVFDIPYALTANKSDKLLLATLMEQTRTAQREEELAAAVAIVLMLTIIPVMLFNVWRTRRED
ncbi:MAG: sugar ABC transporter permease [Hyphomicrobiales bacterium]|nr:sugar ABC transporter permease [Hyphomicrobiales bacterium]MCY4052846.1 sugar ABC transporter permease [Hyphomicrobiales bacterium]